jgi:hypothetical protein
MQYMQQSRQLASVTSSIKEMDSEPAGEGAVAEKNNVKRVTGCWKKDLLHLYESSMLYDCTFKVGASNNDKGGCKVTLFVNC